VAAVVNKPGNNKGGDPDAFTHISDISCSSDGRIIDRRSAAASTRATG
jgi:hypothetical protein